MRVAKSTGMLEIFKVFYSVQSSKTSHKAWVYRFTFDDIMQNVIL